MYTRIVSAAVAIAAAIVLLILHKTFVFNIAIAFISVAAIYELFKATKYDQYKIQSYLCYGYAFLNAFMGVFHRHGWLTFINDRFYFGLFILAMLALYLKSYDKFKYTDLFLMIGITMLITYSMDTLLYMSSFSKTGVFMLVLTLCGAWLADSGAYFVGTFFGKTPLCPNISPKKTLEGVIGGVLCNGIFLIIISLFYDFVLKGESVNYIMVFLAGIGCALVGLVGDLSASLIKRQCNIKDFGNIMPGHGGVMDRFDSVLLVAPFMYYMFTQGWII